MNASNLIVLKNYLVTGCMSFRQMNDGVYIPQPRAFRLTYEKGKCYIELNRSASFRNYDCWGKISFIDSKGKPHKYVFKDYEEFKPLIGNAIYLLTGNVMDQNNEPPLVLKLRAKLFDIIEENATYGMAFKRKVYFANGMFNKLAIETEMNMPNYIRNRDIPMLEQRLMQK